jgi:hypothetical protein
VAIQCCVYVHDMPCRANCIPSTVTHQWEDWTRIHVEPTAYHRLWPTNEKTGLTVQHAMPDQLHTNYFTDQWEDWTHMPFTVNDQWEGCAKPTTRRYRPMRRMQSYLSMLCPAHCLLSIATNEKTRCPSHYCTSTNERTSVTHIFSHCERPAACNRTLHSRQPMKKLHSSHLQSATDIYLNIWWTNLTPYPPQLQYNLKSSQPNQTTWKKMC